MNAPRLTARVQARRTVASVGSALLVLERSARAPAPAMPRPGVRVRATLRGPLPFRAPSPRTMRLRAGGAWHLVQAVGARLVTTRCARAFPRGQTRVVVGGGVGCARCAGAVS